MIDQNARAPHYMRQQKPKSIGKGIGIGMATGIIALPKQEVSYLIALINISLTPMSAHIG